MTLHYRQGSDSYDIIIARGILSRAGEFFDLRRKVLVVTGEEVPEQYAAAVLAQCPEGHLLTIPEGEANKTLESVKLILTALLEHGFTRGDAVIAVGGGVIGDTAGFAAACYMRGINWYNVPTTLLSQADSSVGGKTGVNLNGVKNIVGAFRQPSGVLIDPETLDTLSPRLFSEGMAEIIKMAATCDAEFFRLLETADSLRPIMEVILAAALRIKIAVVEADPQECGIRAVLNFGHTVGHALEGMANRLTTTIPLHPQGTRGRNPLNPSVGHEGLLNPLEGVAADSGCKKSKITPGYYHGEAVAIGMLYMSEGEARDRLKALLVKYGLPTEDNCGVDELIKYALHDKKMKGGKIKLVKLDEIGSFRFEEAGPEELRTIIQARKK